MQRQSRFAWLPSPKIDGVLFSSPFVILRVRHSRGEMYSILFAAVCVSVYLSVPRRIPTTARTWMKLGEWQGCPLVVHYWADLQSVNGFRCCDNIALNAKCQRVLVLAVRLICLFVSRITKIIMGVFT